MQIRDAPGRFPEIHELARKHFRRGQAARGGSRGALILPERQEGRDQDHGGREGGGETCVLLEKRCSRDLGRASFEFDELIADIQSENPRDVRSLNYCQPLREKIRRASCNINYNYVMYNSSQLYPDYDSAVKCATCH
jgi:hypothetical protein